MMRARGWLGLLGVFAAIAGGAPAHAQFYKDKTLTILINFAVGGNADVEARVYQRYLARHIPGNPAIIIQNAPGAGGLNAMNMLGLNIGSKADGMTLGYFTVNAIASIIGDPALRVSLADFNIVAGARGWNVAYGRKDMPPGLSQPADLAKASRVFIGGYARSNAIDTRLRLAMEILGLKYQVVTGFPGTADINKAMLQNEVNITASSLPAYRTQAVPQLVGPGIAMPLFQFPVAGPDGAPIGNPALEKEGFPTFNALYAQAFGKQPAGPKFDSLMLVDTLGTQMVRGIVLPKGSPPEAIDILRQAFREIARDGDFIAEFERVIGEKPDISSAEELRGLSDQVREVDPVIKETLRRSIDE